MDDNSQSQPSRDWPAAPRQGGPSANLPSGAPKPKFTSPSGGPPTAPQGGASLAPKERIFPQPPKPQPPAPSYPMAPSIPKPVMPIQRPVPPAPPPAPRPPMPPAPPAVPKPAMPPLPPMPALNLPSETAKPTPPVAAPISRVSISELSPRKPIAKIFSTALIGLVVVGGLGSLIYFVILPTFFGARPGTPAVTTPTGVRHESFFVNPAAAKSDIKLPSLSALDITTALQNEAFKQLADQQIKEISVADKNGPADFNKFLTALSPALSVLNLSGYFESDFTGFLYYDSNGVWPGYVAKLKASADANALKQALTQLNSATNLDGLYLASPGNFQPFKDGKYKNYITRYSVGGKTGASLNYSVIGDYLIISTSFSGFKAALPLLGL